MKLKEKFKKYQRNLFSQESKPKLNHQFHLYHGINKVFLFSLNQLQLQGLTNAKARVR